MSEAPLDNNARLHPRCTLVSIAQIGLFILAILYTLYFARILFMPLILAVLFGLLLSPLVGGLTRIGLSPWIGSAVVVMVLVGILAGSAYLLVDPASKWLERAPATLAHIKEKLAQFKKPVEQVSRATQEMEKLTETDDQKQPTDAPVDRQRLSGILFAGAMKTVGGILLMLVLLYFLLASGDTFLRKLINVLSTLEGKKRAVDIARQIRKDLSIYLWTITLINTGLGLAVGTAMHLLDMPNPMLWGVMAAVLVFIPYLGPMVGISIVAMVAVLTFNNPSQYLLPPLVYLLLDALQGYFITPAILANRLTLNPVVILLGLIFWGWIWGIAGAVLAVPMLVSFKILCDHLRPLSTIGEFLGR